MQTPARMHQPLKRSPTNTKGRNGINGEVICLLYMRKLMTASFQSYQQLVKEYNMLR